MTDDKPSCPRLLIAPEPTQLELLAILMAIPVPTATEPEEVPLSKWSEAARVEQLQYPLDDRRTGWNR